MNYKKLIIGLFTGGILGFAYYYFIGCHNGSCGITSSPINSVLYGTLIGGVLFFPSKKKKLLDIKNKVIIDVRSKEEFKQGNVKGSINIPISEIYLKVEEIKALDKAIIVCCASGIRSTKAHTFLLKAGIKSENGWSWKNVNEQLNK